MIFIEVLDKDGCEEQLNKILDTVHIDSLMEVFIYQAFKDDRVIEMLFYCEEYDAYIGLGDNGKYFTTNTELAKQIDRSNKLKELGI